MMNVSVLTEHLQKKLPFLTHAISSRSQLPILLYLLLETRDGKLYMSATDLEIGIETNIPATIHEEGGVTVPARLFVELINSLPAGKLMLEVKGTTLEIRSNKTKTELVTMSKEEFPVLFEEKGNLIAQIKSTTLQKDLGRVVFAASPDTTRPSLSGVLMKRKEQGFLLVATDGYRLSLQQNTAENNEEKKEEKTLLIPSRVIREIISLKEAEEIQIFVSPKNNQVLFFQSETILVGRLIEAEFPNYEKIIPANYSTKVSFDREEFQKAVKVCAIFARDAGNIIKLSLQNSMIVVSAHTPSIGENIFNVDAKIEGEEKEIAFNAKYLLDVLANVTADTMTLEMTGPLNPGVFRIVDDASFLHLIMPIRTQE